MSYCTPDNIMHDVEVLRLLHSSRLWVKHSGYHLTQADETVGDVFETGSKNAGELLAKHRRLEEGVYISRMEIKIRLH